MNMRVALHIAAALALAGLSAPALACSIVATRSICDGGAACTDAVVAQMQRERAQREAIEYGRAMAVAMEARQEAAGLDRGYDLARILLPNMVLPIALSEHCFTGDWIAEDEDAGGHESIAEAEVAIRREEGTAPDALVAGERLSAFATRRDACNDEMRRDLGHYLNGAIPADQLSEVWAFIVPRAGGVPPTDPAHPIESRRLTALSASGLPLRYDEVAAPQHIDNRRERAWQYLQNHRNGRLVMSAVSQFIQSRLSDGRGEAAICPVAHAETQSLIGELAQP